MYNFLNQPNSLVKTQAGKNWGVISAIPIQKLGHFRIISMNICCDSNDKTDRLQIIFKGRNEIKAQNFGQTVHSTDLNLIHI